MVDLLVTNPSWVGPLVKFILSVLSAGILFKVLDYLGVIKSIQSWLNKPRLKIEDTEMYRVKVFSELSGVVPGSYKTRTVISWRVMNQKYLGRYGQDVSDMVTSWTLYSIDDDGKVQHIDSLHEKPVPLLPLTGDYPQSVPRSDEFPSGKYRLHLQILSNGVAIKSFSEDFTLTDEFRDT